MNVKKLQNSESANEVRKVNEVDRAVGQRVRVRRLLLGMSQEALGERLGLTFQQVQKYEKGVNRVSASRLFDLGQVLEVPITFFFQEFASNSKFNDAPKEEGALDVSQTLHLLRTDKAVQLMRAFDRIKDESMRTAIVSHVRALAGIEEK